MFTISRKKYAWIAVGLLILVGLIVVPFVFSRVVSTPKLHAFAKEQLEFLLGEEVTIGSMKVSFFFSPSLTLQDVSIGEKISIQSMRGTFSLKNLLGKKNIVSPITIEGIRVHAEALKEMLKKQTSSEKDSPWSVTIPTVTIHSGTIVFAGDNEEATLMENIELTADELAYFYQDGARVTVRGTSAALGGDSAATGYLAFDRATETLRFSEGKARLFGVMFSASGEINMQQDAARTMHVMSNELSLTPLTRLLPELGTLLPQDMGLSGPLSATIDLTWEGEKKTIVLEGDATQATITTGHSFSKGSGYPLTAKLTASVTASDIAVESLNVRFDGTEINIAGTVEELRVQSEKIDAEKLKVHFPLLSPIDALTEAVFTATLQGKEKLTGDVRARKAVVFGKNIDHFSASFSLTSNGCVFGPITGKVAGGNLSAAGHMDFSEEAPTTSVDVTVEGFEANNIKEFGVALGGRATLVEKVTSQGKSRETFAQNLKEEGTLTLSSGTITSLSFFSQLFHEGTWKALAPHFSIPPQEGELHTPPSFEGNIEELGVTFALSGNDVSLSPILLKLPQGSMRFALHIAADKAIEGSGSLTMNEEVLRPPPPQPTDTTTSLPPKKRVTIPFSLHGRLNEMIATVDASSITSETREEEKTELPTVAAPKKSAPAKRSPPPPATPPPPTPAEQMQDIMRVIIGK